MADKRKRRSPWPRPTLHTIFFAVGCTIGRLETMAEEQGLDTQWSSGFNAETVRQVEEQLRQFLPPDVQF